MNKRVLVAASPHTAEGLLPALEEWGARVVPFKAIALRKLHDSTALSNSLANLDQYDWIIFTSSYGVRYFLEHMSDHGLSVDRIRRSKICAVGPATARAAIERDMRVDVIPDVFVAEGIMTALANRAGGIKALTGLRILLPRAKEARDVLHRGLVDAGAVVDLLPCYETVRADFDTAEARKLVENSPDLLVFTSSSNVSNFVAIVGNEDGVRTLQNSVVAALGPVTAGTIAGYGKMPEILPRDNTVPSLLQAIRCYFSKLGPAPG